MIQYSIAVPTKSSIHIHIEMWAVINYQQRFSYIIVVEITSWESY